MKNESIITIIKSATAIIVASLIFASCSANTIEDVLEEEVPLDLVTYQDVKSVFENACTRCHASPPQNGAPMSLVSFTDARSAIQNRGLLDRINREDGASGLMPLGGPRLPQNTINLLFQWKDDGLLENQ